MTPEDLAAFHRRQEHAEPPVERAFRAWVRRIRNALTIETVEEALRTGIAAAVQYAIDLAGPLGINLRSFAEQEGEIALQQAVAEVGDTARAFGLSFNIVDPRFEQAVEEAGARGIREVTQETRDAVNELVARAYRSGWHPRQFAPQVAQMVGLTRRQSMAAANYYSGLLGSDTPEDRAASLADAYSRRLLKQRGMTIARYETMRAANASRLMGYRQAADNGLFNRTRAYLVWMAADDPRTCPACLALDGMRAPLDAGFDEPPPLHVQCRCVQTLQVDRA